VVGPHGERRPKCDTKDLRNKRDTKDLRNKGDRQDKRLNSKQEKSKQENSKQDNRDNTLLAGTTSHTSHTSHTPQFNPQESGVEAERNGRVEEAAEQGATLRPLQPKPSPKKWVMPVKIPAAIRGGWVDPWEDQRRHTCEPNTHMQVNLEKKDKVVSNRSSTARLCSLPEKDASRVRVCHAANVTKKHKPPFKTLRWSAVDQLAPRSHTHAAHAAASFTAAGRFLGILCPHYVSVFCVSHTSFSVFCVSDASFAVFGVFHTL